MEKAFKERIVHVLDEIESKISSMNKDNLSLSTVTASCRIQSEIEVLAKILDRDSEEFGTLLSINEKALKKYDELGIFMVNRLSEIQNRQ